MPTGLPRAGARTLPCSAAQGGAWKTGLSARNQRPCP